MNIIVIQTFSSKLSSSWLWSSLSSWLIIIVSIVIIIIIMVTMIVIIVIIIISIFIVIKISHRHNWLPKFPKQYLMLRSGKCKWLESWLIYFYLTDYSFPITNPKIIIVIVITFVIVRVINITNCCQLLTTLANFRQLLKIRPSFLFVAIYLTATKVSHSTGVATTNSTTRNPNANKLSWADQLYPSPPIFNPHVLEHLLRSCRPYIVESPNILFSDKIQWNFQISFTCIKFKNQLD